MRIHVLLVLLFAVATLPLWAQPGRNMGTVRGVVSYDDGTPYGGADVNVKDVNGAETNVTSDPDGNFAQLVPAGATTVTCREATATVNVIATQVSAAALLKVKRTGVMLTLSYPEGDVVAGGIDRVIGAYDKNDNYGRYDADFEAVGNGRYWASEIPADTKQLAILVSMSPNGAAFVRKQWEFTDEQPLRKLAITVGRPANVRFTLLDEAGNPLRNTAVRGDLSYPQVNTRAGLQYMDHDPTTTPGHYALRGMATDNQGQLELGQFAAQHYNLMLLVGTKAGAMLPFEVTAKGEQTVNEYTVKYGTRDVTETVRTADGKPLAGVEMSISYAWADKTVLLRQLTDAQGVVVWAQLPPVRVISWGGGLPAGVIFPADTAVTTPLPAPDTSAAQLPVQLIIDAADPAAMEFDYIARGLNIMDINTGVQEGMAATTPHRVTVNATAATGNELSLLLWSKTVRPFVAAVPDFYIPYDDAVDGASIPLTLTPSPVVRGKFLNFKGQPLPGVSRFAISCTSSGAIADLLRSPEAAEKRLLTPIEEPGGRYTVATLVPGKFRALVDLYDEAAASIPVLRWEVAAGEQVKDITLPENLTAVTSGAELFWVTNTAPAHARSMVVQPYGGKVPVFGPKENLLALWYRSAPDELVLWNATDKKTPLQKFTLKVNYLTPLTAHPGDYQIRPFLPTKVLLIEQFMGYSAAHSTPESLPNECKGTQMTRVNLWPGKYAVIPSFENPDKFLTLESPADGNGEMAIMLDPLEAPPKEPLPRVMNLVFPKKAVPEDNDNCVVYADDNPDPIQQLSMRYDLANNTASIIIPLTAKKITLQWPGVGVITDIPAQEQLTLPNWTPGGSLNATVLRADGTPQANTMINGKIWLGGTVHYFTVNSDDMGKFSYSGLRPGKVELRLDNEGNSLGNWVVITTDGNTQVTLREAGVPTRFNVQNSNFSDIARAWWVPANGPAQEISSEYASFSSSELKPGPGNLWLCDPAGHSALLPTTAKPGEQQLNITPAGPGLGITFPYDTTRGMPGTITLQGKDALADIDITLSYPNWVLCPQLGLIMAQLDAIPAGNYTITVKTKTAPVTMPVTVTENGGVATLAWK